MTLNAEILKEIEANGIISESKSNKKQSENAEIDMFSALLSSNESEAAEKIMEELGIEVNKRDFLFYRDMDMISCDAKDLSKNITKFKDANVILIDLNGILQGLPFSSFKYGNNSARLHL